MSTDQEKLHDAIEALNDMDGGVFMQKVARALQDTALGVVSHGDKGKKGKVTLELEISRIGESMQVAVAHTLKKAQPTRRGKATEEDKTETPFYVTSKGKMTIVPENQTDWIDQ